MGGGGGENTKKKIHASQNVRKKEFLQAESEEKKILAEGNLAFKVIILKIPLIVMTANFLQNALKQRF